MRSETGSQPINAFEANFEVGFEANFKVGFKANFKVNKSIVIEDL